MRRRLTIAVVGTVAVSLLLAGIVTLALVRRADRQDEALALEARAREIRIKHKHVDAVGDHQE